MSKSHKESKKILTRKELDAKLKKIQKKSKKIEDEIDKKKKEMMKEINSMEKKSQKLKRKVDDIHQEIIDIKYVDSGRSFAWRYFPHDELIQEHVTLPQDIVNYILTFCYKTNPICFLINKASYKVLQALVYDNLSKEEIEGKSISLDTYNRAERLMCLLKEYKIVDDISYRLSHIKVMSDNNDYQNLTDLDFKQKTFYSYMKIRRLIIILEILFKKLLKILIRTFDYHKAALKTNQNTVTLNNYKTDKWYLTQNVTAETKRHYIKRMYIVIEKDGGPFKFPETHYLWMLKIYSKCFGCLFEKFKTFFFGKSQKRVITEILFV